MPEGAFVVYAASGVGCGILASCSTNPVRICLGFLAMIFMLTCAFLTLFAFPK